MKCPSCEAPWPPWHLLLLSDWRPINCPACGFKAGRQRDFRLFAISLFYMLALVVPLYCGLEHYVSWPVAILLMVASFGLSMFVDAATIRLVPAEAHKMRVKTVLLLALFAIGVPVITAPVVAYVTGVRDSDCRDWSQTLRAGRARLKACDDPKERYYALGQTAKAAAELREYQEAERYATEVLTLAPSFPRDWNYGNAIHDGHMVLGRVALSRGDRVSARRELLLAGNSPGSPQLNTSGPNMALARDLLRSGDRETVFQYFDECERFWEFGHAPIKRWKTLARFHLPPDFGANLLF